MLNITNKNVFSYHQSSQTKSLTPTGIDTSKQQIVAQDETNIYLSIQFETRLLYRLFVFNL